MAVSLAGQREASGAVRLAEGSTVAPTRRRRADGEPPAPDSGTPPQPSLMAQDGEPQHCQPWTPQEDCLILQRHLDWEDEPNLLALSELLPVHGMEDTRRRMPSRRFVEHYRIIPPLTTPSCRTLVWIALESRSRQFGAETAVLSDFGMDRP
jgi:hypothetical protein